jgi:threonine dehydratase
MLDIPSAVLSAESKIRPYIRETPLDYAYPLSHSSGAQVYFKLDNLQHTGSFKVRGAMNKLLSLTPAEQKRGIVTASTGNHGAATAFGLHRLNHHGLIFVPQNASPTKLNAIRSLGGTLRLHGDDGAVTELYARSYAAEHDMVYISPYNDPQIIGGQGTLGVELTRQLDTIDAVFIALGGGGLISGVGGYLRSIHPNVKLIACSPEHSAVMYESIRAGHIVELESKPTLSDGTAGGIEPGAITFPLCRDLIDEHVLVSETEIASAMIEFMETQHMLIEGSAGVALAAFLKTQHLYQDQHVVIVMCGANISLQTLAKVLEGV